MAARTVRLFQDQNVTDHVYETGTVSGKTDFTGQRKSKLGGRKPLGDLSNSVKPFDLVDGKKTLNGPLKTVKPSVILNKSKNKSNSTLILNKEVVSGSKASKKSNTGSRKPLTDISNSALAKLHAPDIKNKKSLKTSSLTGKYLHPDAIAEERMLHDHEQCIKSKTQALDRHHFFKTVGLEDDSDDAMKISFEPLASKLKPESALWKLEEVHEEMPESPRSAEHGSPIYCKSPEFSSRTMWDDLAVDFKLIDSP
ncbi:protein PATRONUS 1-like [Trifolium pratense]|uniref:protein PATRONUS 1-like n=1 Tax=Trifolium pratense TaxID=57577 RepID=UPI001E694656|nr:protein PATRONUS 1-like [Trifolium pratense]